MMDYNDGLLPEPCLRMDTHFGDEYESVEFGDGTGYVKAVPMLARLGALHVELDELCEENAKLRELCKDMMAFVEDDDACERCGHDVECVEAADGELVLPYDGQCLMLDLFADRMRELGVEVD